MASTTGIEIGPHSCTLVDIRPASDRTGAVRAIRHIGPAEWPVSEGARTELLRSIRRTARLPRQAVVVAWDGPHMGEDAPARAVLPFLANAGFQIRSVLSPAQALARVAQRRPRFASQDATVWTALNVDAVAIAIVRGADVLYARVFPWTYTQGLTGSRAILLQRYSLIAHLAPHIRHGVKTVRAAHDLSIDRVVTCGNLPDLRSLTMPLIEELDLEVETLDSTEGLRAAGDVTTERLSDAAPAIRLAAASAINVPETALGTGRDRSPSDPDEPSTLLRATAALALIVAVSWGAFAWRQAMAPARVRPMVVPERSTRSQIPPDAGSRVAPPSAPVRSDARGSSSPAGPSRGDARSVGTSDEPNESTPVSTVLSVQGQPRSSRGGETASAAENGSQAAAGTPVPSSATPASLPVTQAPVVRHVQPVPMKEELPSIDSILIDQERRLAVIDGAVVGVGDRVGGRIVAQIDQDAVTLREPSGLLVRASVRSRQRN